MKRQRDRIFLRGIVSKVIRSGTWNHVIELHPLARLCQNPPHGSEGIVSNPAYNTRPTEVYALANEHGFFQRKIVRKRVNFFRLDR